MHYQVYVEGENKGAADVLNRLGMGDFAEGCRETPMRRDPGGPMGLMISWGGDIGFFPERQRVVECDGYLLVLWTDRPCVPVDLMRVGQFLGGWDVEMGDGNRWPVPTAADLPKTFRLVGKDWRQFRKPQFDEFWRQSEIWYRRVMDHALEPEKVCESENLTENEYFGQVVEFCVFALRQNLRINSVIASELGLFDSMSVFRVIDRVVDKMLIAEVVTEMNEAVDEATAFGKKKGTRSGTGDS